MAVALFLMRALPSPGFLALLILGLAVVLWWLLRDYRQWVIARVEAGRLTLTAAKGGNLPARLDGPFDLAGSRGTFYPVESARVLVLSTAHRGTMILSDEGTPDLTDLVAVLERNSVPITR